MEIRLDGLKSKRKNPGASRGAKPEIIIGAFEDVLVWPNRDDKGVRMLGDMVMKPGARHYKSYFTPSTQVKGFETEAEEDNLSISPKFTGSIPGDELEQNEFIANWLGVNAFVMTRGCGDEHWKVIGTPCAPLQMVPTFEANNDKTGFDIEFTAYAKSDMLPGFYYGNVTLEVPNVVADASALAITKADGLSIVLPESNTVTAISVASEDLETRDLVTLVGNGGSSPATLSNGTAGSAEVILKDGVQWEALDGASISLRTIKDDTTTYLVEESRS